jgi:hypothetical protein
VEITDQESLRQWQAQQHNDDEQDPPIEPPLHPLDAQTVTALIMLICAPNENGTISWKPSFRRLAVIASIISPDIGRLTLDRIARDLTAAGLPTTRAALSSINCQLRDTTGFTRSDKSERARKSYRERACAVWNKRTNRSMAPNQ